MLKKKANKQLVISLGGSLIVPSQEVNWRFLKNFRKLILKELSKYKRIFLVAGGGTTARHYIKGLKKTLRCTSNDCDWLGIYSTRLNAHLVRIIFKPHSFSKIIKNPFADISFRKKIIVAGGWRPGNSTDYVATLIAQKYKIKTIINLSNIDYVYTADPHKNKKAKKIENINWHDFRKLVGDKWRPGLKVPFDPIASKKSQLLGLKVVVINGWKLENLRNYLSGKPFKGTIISDE